ncbi:MAG: protein YghO [Wenzhouxiangellaceae bacterium]
MTKPAPGALSIEEVQTRRQWRAFHTLPARLRRTDTAWVPPLGLHERQRWAPRHPVFTHLTARAWIVLRDGEVVGRISAQDDRLQAEQGRPELGHFGQIEAIDDRDVFRALIDAASDWLIRRGKTVMQGPFDLTINQQCGLLVDGFDVMPAMMMNHHPLWYQGHLEAVGMVPVAELLAYRGAADFPLPRAARRVLRGLQGRLSFRALTSAELRRHAEVMRELFNASWARNWGFIPFTAEEFRHLVHEMKPLLRPGYVQLAMLDSRPVGFMVALPDLNLLIRDLDGRLWPTGWAKLLYRLMRGRFEQVRIPLLGVHPDYHRTPEGAAIAYGLIHAIQSAVLRDGVSFGEQSWILEQNRGIRSIIESLGMQVVQRFRIYQLELQR